MPRIYAAAVLATLAVLLVSCSTPPDEQTITDDLIGKTLSTSEESWQITAPEDLADLLIEEEREIGEATEYVMSATLKNSEKKSHHQAVIKATYRKRLGSWKMTEASLESAERIVTEEMRQQETIKTIRDLGTALLSFLTDEGSDSVSSGDYPFSYEELVSMLKTSEDYYYMKDVPELDGWGHPLEVWVNSSEWPDYTAVILSPGQDGEFGSEALTKEPFPATQSDRDIAWADGYFLAWPQSQE
ncbi:MAG: hypothetical protein AAGM22_05325 [Acidobacteriota bacterium]